MTRKRWDDTTGAQIGFGMGFVFFVVGLWVVFYNWRACWIWCDIHFSI